VKKVAYVFASLCLSVLAGCYALQPASTAVPRLGTRVAFDVNDAGRLALGGSMGPEIDQVEGNLLETESDAYLLSVTAVRLLRGGEQRWAGEAVRIKREYINNTYVRQFSPGRTIAVSVAGVAAVAAIATASLSPGGFVDIPDDTSTTGGARRVPRFPGARTGKFGKPLSPLWLQPHLGRP
jgi:hypothetical protein